MRTRQSPKRLPLLPTQALLAMEAPTGSSRYDMVGEIMAAAQAAPDHAPQSGPVHGAICFLRELLGQDAAPVGELAYVDHVGEDVLSICGMNALYCGSPGLRMQQNCSTSPQPCSHCSNKWAGRLAAALCAS